MSTTINGKFVGVCTGDIQQEIAAHLCSDAQGIFYFKDSPTSSDLAFLHEYRREVTPVVHLMRTAYKSTISDRSLLEYVHTSPSTSEFLSYNCSPEYFTAKDPFFAPYADKKAQYAKKSNAFFAMRALQEIPAARERSDKIIECLNFQGDRESEESPVYKLAAVGRTLLPVRPKVTIREPLVLPPYSNGGGATPGGDSPTRQSTSAASTGTLGMFVGVRKGVVEEEMIAQVSRAQEVFYFVDSPTNEDVQRVLDNYTGAVEPTVHLMRQRYKDTITDRSVLRAVTTSYSPNDFAIHHAPGRSYGSLTGHSTTHSSAHFALRAIESVPNANKRLEIILECLNFSGTDHRMSPVGKLEPVGRTLCPPTPCTNTFDASDFDDFMEDGDEDDGQDYSSLYTACDENLLFVCHAYPTRAKSSVADIGLKLPTPRMHSLMRKAHGSEVTIIHYYRRGASDWDLYHEWSIFFHASAAAPGDTSRQIHTTCLGTYIEGTQKLMAMRSVMSQAPYSREGCKCHDPVAALTTS